MEPSADVIVAARDQGAKLNITEAVDEYVYEVQTCFDLMCLSESI